mgnify:CR=1 FL=1
MSTSNKIQAIFIDRDGTIGGSEEVIYPGAFKLFPFTKQSFEILRSAGVPIYAFTNQPGISRGDATIGDFQNELTSFGFDYDCCPKRGVYQGVSKNRIWREGFGQIS